jgi:hypothetical protein
METGIPDFGDNISRVGDIIRYPRRVLIQALKSAFSEEHLFGFDNPFLYKAEENGDTSKESRLEIADMFTNELNATDPRPIIIAQRGHVPFGEGSIGTLLKMDTPHGKWKTFTIQIRIPINFLCFARVDVESEELALVTAFVLRLFRERTVKSTKLFKIDTPEVQMTTPIETGAQVELFSTGVVTGTVLTLVWKVTQTDSFDPKDISLNITF